MSLKDHKKLVIVTSSANYPEKVESRNGFKVLDTHVNLKWLLDQFDAVIRNNQMKRQWEVAIPGHFIFDEDAENSAIELAKYLATINMMPIKSIGNHIKTLAEMDSYHPVVDAVKAKAWDGIARVQEFIDTLPTVDKEMTRIIVRTWMVSCIAAIFSPRGFVAHGVLVLQGGQGIGKTGWIKSLDPIDCGAVKEAAQLDPTNKDDVLSAMKHWIVELGELDSTFRKDIARLKSFITAASDHIRNPYAYKASHYYRRTVFAGSVNTETYLVDDTGNRRWWTIPLIRNIRFDHGLDMQQIWAEIYALWIAGHPTQLDREAQERVNDRNSQFEKIDPIKEKLLLHYDWASLSTREMTTTQVMEELGYTKASRTDVTHCGKLIKQLTGGKGREIKGLFRHPVPLFSPTGNW